MELWQPSGKMRFKSHVPIRSCHATVSVPALLKTLLHPQSNDIWLSHWGLLYSMCEYHIKLVLYIHKHENTVSANFKAHSTVLNFSFCITAGIILRFINHRSPQNHQRGTLVWYPLSPEEVTRRGKGLSLTSLLSHKLGIRYFGFVLKSYTSRLFTDAINLFVQYCSFLFGRFGVFLKLLIF